MWEAIGTLHAVSEDEPTLEGPELVAATAEASGLSDRQIQVAVRYYAAYRAEIDEWIEANREAADESEAAWLAERELLRPSRGRAS